MRIVKKSIKYSGRSGEENNKFQAVRESSASSKKLLSIHKGNAKLLFRTRFLNILVELATFLFSTLQYLQSKL